MKPGLAGLVASDETTNSDFLNPRSEIDGDVAAVLDALGRDFTLVPEQGSSLTQAKLAPRRRTWLDTFDWRLHRAGLLLEYVPAHRGGELRLTARRSATQDPGENENPSMNTAGLIAAQPVAGWQSVRPHLAGDLPVGPVTDHVASVIGPRALLPLVTVSTDVGVTRLLNEDAKTVARLLVEHPALANGSVHPLSPRLTIAEVRGYSGSARRAARIITEATGFDPVQGDLLTEALAVGGRQPGDYTSKIDADITASMPSGQAVAVVLLRLLDMAEANVPGVLADIDTEFLHDFRVAVRRTRAALKLFGAALGRPADVARFAAEFKWLGDITTPTRDLDVYLLGFEDLARKLKAAKPDDLEAFRDYLRGRRAKEYRALARALRTMRFRDLTREWRDKLTPLTPGSPGGAGSKRPKAPGISAATLAAETTRKAFVKVARMGGAITPDSPSESLHDLRKRCKELRYALEFFAPLYAPSSYGRVIGDLKRLQDCLGTFQDNEVQIREIRSLATAMQAVHEAPAVTLLAMGEVAAGLVDGQAAARADFGRRFSEFAGIEGQRRMSALLRGGLNADLRHVQH
ncbi:MAG TPA: CHAD domain-containing protein [Trebonia sp.]|jgi:CHAD domain-containing protein|nr:CHAD domain-containing protein [Trebonia sp.]